MTALAAALEAINERAQQFTEPSQLLVAAKCRGLLAGYDWRWNDAPWRVLSTEQVVEADLWNPATNARSRSFRLAGKIDARVEYEGRQYIVDHKTTSADIADPSGAYWRQLAVDAQLSHYMLLEWLNGRKADGGIWDVIRKPAISPKKLTKKEQTMTLMSRAYLGQQLSDESCESLAQTERESLEMYERRLFLDTTERPFWYFQRRAILRLDAEIHQHAEDLWDHSQEILAARRNNRHSRNGGACLQYGSPCKFLGICSGHDEPESDRWQRKAQVHPELPVVYEDSGRGVLTKSRLQSFLTCRRKHYFEYEVGLERQDAEEREALFFGELLHYGLEKWFQAKQDERMSDDNTSSPASAVGTATSA